MNLLFKCCAGLPQVNLERGAVMLTENAKSGKLYILIEGEVAVLRGDVVVATISEPGAVFGEMSLLLDAPHTASVMALRPTKAYLAENAESFVKDNPEILRYIAALLALRLQSATGYLADLKRQFAESQNHLGMIDEVLDSLLNQQNSEFNPGPAQESDPRL
jgi:CRP/FNR family transcriptional regulator, cyclic AMP receptor protein